MRLAGPMGVPSAVVEPPLSVAASDAAGDRAGTPCQPLIPRSSTRSRRLGRGASASLAQPADRGPEVLDLIVPLDRQRQLGRARTETLSRIHHLLLELIPGRGEEAHHPRPGQLPAVHRAAAGGHRSPDPPRPRL